MIKKAQIKFICIIMSIILGFLSIISFVSIILLRNVNNRNIEDTLSETIRMLPFITEENAPSNVFIIRLRSSQTYELIYTDSKVFSIDSINELFLKIKNHPQTLGRIDNVYYRFVDANGQNLLFALDASTQISELSNSIVKMILIFLAIYIVLLIIVYLFSFSVFEPIKENIAKQKQFVSNASHELKTPLAIISANSDVLEKTTPNQWVDNIKNQCERLEIIVSDMLEMAKIDETKPKAVKEEFNLSDEIIKTTLPFDSLAFEKGKMLDLDVPNDILYKGDKESVKKILNILLDNAVKYASKDGLIKVSLSKKNGRYILSVYNTGSAVPSEQANKIFERFYRFENSRSRETGGSGLGLAIAKDIARNNRWKISAISKQNEYMIINVIL